jgi:hypothetical protein
MGKVKAKTAISTKIFRFSPIFAGIIPFLPSFTGFYPSPHTKVPQLPLPLFQPKKLRTPPFRVLSPSPPQVVTKSEGNHKAGASE